MFSTNVMFAAASRFTHLFLGTQADNVADCVAKGRQARGEAISASKRGEGNPKAKLTEVAVRAIRADTRTLQEIAADHGVSLSLVGEIKRGRFWRHVE